VEQDETSAKLARKGAILNADREAGEKSDACKMRFTTAI